MNHGALLPREAREGPYPQSRIVANPLKTSYELNCRNSPSQMLPRRRWTKDWRWGSENPVPCDQIEPDSNLAPGESVSSRKTDRQGAISNAIS